MDDEFSTGSSIMPQKKNPDFAELVRGKTGRVFGDLQSLLVTLKGLPLAYNKDMQEDKEPAFDAIDTLADSLRAMSGMLDTMQVNADAMRAGARGGFMAATDLADYLVGKGVPFREAHEVVGGSCSRASARAARSRTSPPRSSPPMRRSSATTCSTRSTSTRSSRDASRGRNGSRSGRAPNSPTNRRARSR